MDQLNVHTTFDNDGYADSHEIKYSTYKLLATNSSKTQPQCLFEKYTEKPWEWEWISLNPNLTMEIIEKYPDKPWKWEWISSNPNITMEMIEKYPDKPWNWDFISENPNLTMEFIEKHLDKINFNTLSKNKIIFKTIVAKKQSTEIEVWDKNKNCILRTILYKPIHEVKHTTLKILLISAIDSQ